MILLSLIEITWLVKKKKDIISSISSLGERHCPQLNPLHLKGDLCQVDWNWLSGSGEEDENVNSLQLHQRERGVEIRNIHLCDLSVGLYSSTND
jgi:hypothetical protein